MTYRLALAVLLAAVGYAQQQETVTYTYNGLPLFIARDSADVISIANISVPRALTITSVTAKLQIDYPNSGDLKVYLFSPTGVRTILLEHSCSVAGIDTTFDDSAPQLWKDFCPTELGRAPFRANEPLSNFRAEPSSLGTWRLSLENDSSDSRSGYLTGFSLTITGTRQVTPIFATQTVVNAVNLISGAIAPGELVSIYGAALGPTTPVSAPSGTLPTTLGGVTVTFDGVAVPIVYASLYRVDVQAPFSLSAGSQTNIQVSSAGSTSRSVAVSLSAAAPGIVTVQPDGTGPVKGVNQDGMLNSPTRGAAKGSVVSVYASGLGMVTPALAAGAAPPASPLSMVTAGVAASMGGVPARVVFAGLAPGLPGYYQVNIEVPADSRSGSQQLIISTNGVPSQNGALIQIQ